MSLYFLMFNVYCHWHVCVDNFQWNKSDYIKLTIGPLQHAKVFSCFLSRVLALLIIVSMVAATGNKMRWRDVLGGSIESVWPVAEISSFSFPDLLPSSVTMFLLSTWPGYSLGSQLRALVPRFTASCYSSWALVQWCKFQSEAPPWRLNSGRFQSKIWRY